MVTPGRTSRRTGSIPSAARAVIATNGAPPGRRAASSRRALRSGQVVVVGGAEKTVAIRQDFQDALGKNMAFLFALGLQDLEDEVLLAQATGAGQFKGPSNFGQLGDVFFF